MRLAQFALIIAMFNTACTRPAGELFPRQFPRKLWPPPPATGRIEWIGQISGSHDLSAGRSFGESLGRIFRGPRPPISLLGPNAIALSSTGAAAVTDGPAAGVHLINLTTRDHTLVTGWNDQRFGVPIGAAWVGDELFVTDAKRGDVIVMDAGGEVKRVLSGGAVKRPVGIAWSEARESLYMVDGAAHAVKVIDVNGNLRTTIGGRGIQPGQFNYPTHLCVTDDRLIVADSGNFRVQILDLDGKPIKLIGQKGDGAGDLSLPKGVAVDSDGHLYVVDAQFENVQLFSQQGQLLMAFGEEGDGKGQFSIPSGITIDHLNRIWMADANNHRIQVFQYHSKQGPAE
jgi:sugar lactone lactonase YvrE